MQQSHNEDQLLREQQLQTPYSSHGGAGLLFSREGQNYRSRPALQFIDDLDTKNGKVKRFELQGTFANHFIYPGLRLDRSVQEEKQEDQVSRVVVVCINPLLN